MSNLRETSAAVFILPAHTGRPSRSWPRGCAEGCRANPSRGSAVSRPRCAVPLPPPSTSTSLTLSSSHVHMKAAVKYTFIENPGALMEIQTVSLLILLSVWLKICTFLLVLCVNAFYITAASFTTSDLCWPQFRWEFKYRRTLTRVSEILCLAIRIKTQRQIHDSWQEIFFSDGYL